MVVWALAQTEYKYKASLLCESYYEIYEILLALDRVNSKVTNNNINLFE